MDIKLRNTRPTWLGLTLAVLAMLGLMARVHHPQRTVVQQVGIDTLAPAVEMPAAAQSTAASSPASSQDDLRHWRTALSMPYFSFARLLRPGS